MLPNRDRQGAAATFITFGGPKAHRNSPEGAAVCPGTGRNVHRRKSWKLHLHSGQRIEDLARMLNPKIRGWLKYYGRFYSLALYPPLRQLD